MSQRHLLLGCALCAVLVCTVLVPAGAGVFTYKKVALTGDPAPGTTETFGEFAEAPSVSPSGNVGLHAYLERDADCDHTNDEGVWGGGPDTLQLWGREGDPAPGVPGETLHWFLTPNVTDAGDLAVGMRFNDNTYSDWSGAPGAAALAVREGDPAPGTTRDFTDVPLRPSVNSGGTLALTCQVNSGSSSDQGIWTGQPGSMSLLVREGDPAPGIAGLVNLWSPGGVLINNSDQVAFRTNLSGDTTDDTNSALYAGDAGSLAPVVREGDAAPGTGGAAYSRFDDMSFNNSAHLAFTSKLTGTGVTADNDYAVFSNASGSMDLIAREGDAAPGMGTGAVFDVVGDDLLISNDGKVAFIGRATGGTVTSANDYGLWFGDGNGLELVVREGDEAPGSAGGHLEAVSYFTVNAQGVVVFKGQVDETNNVGIWAWRNGALNYVALEGQMFDADGMGDAREIDDLNILLDYPSGGGDGLAKCLNDIGTLAFELEFIQNIGGSWVMTEGAYLAYVPEPATLALLTLGGGVLLARRRRT